MRFAPRSQGFFSEGIKDSVDKMHNREELFSELKIFDLNSFTKGPIYIPEIAFSNLAQ